LYVHALRLRPDGSCTVVVRAVSVRRRVVAGGGARSGVERAAEVSD
jgi:hypothetical protein